MKKPDRSQRFLHMHSLSLATLGLVIMLIVLYAKSDPSTHLGSFFGNAIADWSGVLVTLIITKYLYEKGSAQSKRPNCEGLSPVKKFLKEHSLTLFLLITGAAWVVAFHAMDPNGRWGQVVGNIVSEWTQILGMVLLTKKLIEAGSKDCDEKED
jgi:hypothetical protein